MQQPTPESMRPQETRAFAIRSADFTDDAGLARIYNHYVSASTVTFEEVPLGPEDMRARIAGAADARLPFLVAETGGELLGFAQAGRWKGRCAYRFSAETSVYVDPRFWRRGIGLELYTRLIALLQGAGMHAAIGGIALPNEPSVALHDRLGFRQVARFREVGFKFGRWIDVGYWQRLFD